jgi:hypothetical protein
MSSNRSRGRPLFCDDSPIPDRVDAIVLELIVFAGLRGVAGGPILRIACLDCDWLRHGLAIIRVLVFAQARELDRPSVFALDAPDLVILTSALRVGDIRHDHVAFVISLARAP